MARAWASSTPPPDRPVTAVRAVLAACALAAAVTAAVVDVSGALTGAWTSGSVVLLLDPSDVFLGFEHPAAKSPRTATTANQRDTERDIDFPQLEVRRLVIRPQSWLLLS